MSGKTKADCGFGREGQLEAEAEKPVRAVEAPELPTRIVECGWGPEKGSCGRRQRTQCGPSGPQRGWTGKAACGRGRKGQLGAESANEI